MSRKSQRELERIIEELKPSSEEAPPKSSLTDTEWDMYDNLFTAAYSGLSDEQLDRVDALLDTTIEELEEGRDLEECSSFPELFDVIGEGLRA